MANNPLVGFSDAMKIELRSGWWVFVLLGLEVIRQLHFLLSRALGGLLPVLDRGLVFGGFEHGSLTGGSRTGPGSASRGCWPGFSGSPYWPWWWARSSTPRPWSWRWLRLPQIIWHVLPYRAAGRADPAVRGAPVRRAVLLPVPRRRGRVLPGRHQDPVLRRLGPGPRTGAGQGKHHLPGEPRAGRGKGRLRTRGPAAVGTARDGQDPDGRGGRGRDRAAVRVRRPRGLHQHVHGCRHPEGEVAVP